MTASRSEPRICALPHCDEPLVRRRNECLRDFTERQCCCPAHSYEHRARLLRGQPRRERTEPGMSAARAAIVLAMVEPRLRWQFEELPASEQAKVLAARGLGVGR